MGSTLCSLWNLSFPTKDQTHAPCIGSAALTTEQPGKSLVTFVVRHYLLVTGSIKVGFKNSRVVWEKARQDGKEMPLRRGLSVGLVPCGISKGIGMTGSHLIWPEVIKLHHYLVQKDKNRQHVQKGASLNRMSLSLEEKSTEKDKKGDIKMSLQKFA